MRTVSTSANNISAIDALWTLISEQPPKVQKALLERLQKTFNNDTKMSEDEFYQKIDKSLESGLSDNVMHPDESGIDFLNRILK